MTPTTTPTATTPAAPPTAPAAADGGPPPPAPGTPTPGRRPSSSPVRIVVGVVVVVVALGMVAATIASAMGSSTQVGTDTFADVEAITFDVDNGHVELVAGGTDVVVDHEVRTGRFGAEVTAEVTGGTLHLTHDCPAWSGLVLGSDCAGEYVVSVPAGVVVTGVTDNGGVRVTGLDASVDVRTSNGAIHLVETSGHVAAHSSNGRIIGTNLESRRVEVGTSNGGVVLDFATAPDQVEVDTSNGGVHVQVPDDGTSYAVDSSTSVGSVSTSVPTDQSAARRLDLQTSIGDVVISTR